MNDPHSQRDAQLAELLDEARAELRDSGRIETTLRRVRDRELAAEVADLIETVEDLDAAAFDWRAAAGATIVEASAENRLPAGTRLGRYEIEAHLASGGMGSVYRARDPELHRTVAIKVPQFERSATSQTELRKRFLREARAAAGVRHPNVCPIHDVGEHEGMPYAVMACIEGQTLADLLEQGLLDVPRALDLFRKIALGLEAVHERKIVHRDLKPRNVLLDAKEEPYLTDFGLSRPEADAENLTSSGTMVGTPAYMAPEQIAGRSELIGPRTDVYSLGVLLYQMLAGRLPFTGSSFTLVHQITHADPPPLSQFRPGLDPALEQAVLKAMARAPGERFASAREFADVVAGRELSGGRASATHASPLLQRMGLVVGLGVGGGLLLMLAFAGSKFGPALFRGGEKGPDKPAVAAGDPGEVIVKSNTPNYEVLIKQHDTTIVKRTRERRFSLPPGDYEFELHDPTSLNVVVRKAFSLESGQELELDATVDIIMIQPEQPGAVRAALSWFLDLKGEYCAVQIFTNDGKMLTISETSNLPEGDFYAVGISLAAMPNVKDEDISRLRKLANLERLSLENSPVTDAALDGFNPRWQLRVLNLAGTGLTDEGLARLAKNYRRLRQLEVSDTSVTEAGVARFRKAVPDCEVFWTQP